MSDMAVLALLPMAGMSALIGGLGVLSLHAANLNPDQAVALAAQKTIANLFGALSIGVDRPFREGDVVKVGEVEGTVEAIGLRSTRIRSLDRTLITVPNAEFSQLQIVNFTRRDMNLFQCSIGLRYETTADQLRYVAAKIRKLLIQHSKVLPDPARVRLSEFGASAYVLDVFALVQCADWNEFLAVKEDLNLRIIDIVAESGTGFAFPSQTVYLGRDSGLDQDRGMAAAREVQKWRDERRLPFPEFDFAERAEMAGTIAFPSASSPDYRPTPARQAGDPAAARKPPPRNRWAALLRRRAPAAPADATSA